MKDQRDEEQRIRGSKDQRDKGYLGYLEEGSREPEGRIQWFLLCNPKGQDLNQGQTDHLMSSVVDTGRQLNGYARVIPASVC
jgi:hypothetical protein